MARRGQFLLQTSQVASSRAAALSLAAAKSSMVSFATGDGAPSFGRHDEIMRKHSVCGRSLNHNPINNSDASGTAHTRRFTRPSECGHTTVASVADVLPNMVSARESVAPPAKLRPFSGSAPRGPKMCIAGQFSFPNAEAAITRAASPIALREACQGQARHHLRQRALRCISVQVCQDLHTFAPAPFRGYGVCNRIQNQSVRALHFSDSIPFHGFNS